MSTETLMSKTKAALGAALLGTSSAEGSSTALHQEGGQSWRLEYVPKEHNGEPYLAERLIKHDDATGEREVLGEFDTTYALADAAPRLPGLPDRVRTQIAASALSERGEKSVGDLGMFRLPAMS